MKIGTTLHRSTLAAGLALVVAMAHAAPKGPRLAEYAPASVNIYIEVTDLKAFAEAGEKSPLVAGLKKSKDVAELAGLLSVDDFSFEGTPLGGIFKFDKDELGRHMTGAAALWNSHYGPMSEVAPEMGEIAKKMSHFDAVLVFEHDGTKKDVILDLFRQSIEKDAQNPEKSREKIGGTTVHTYRVKEAGEVPDVRLKENVPENTPYEERIEVVMTPIEAQNVFEFAVLDGVALFGEGSNRPVTTALTAIEKKKESLGRKPAFKTMLEGFRGNDASAEGLVVYIDFEYLHRAAERESNPAMIANRTASGMREFLFAGGILRLADAAPSLDVYLGTGDKGTGMAGMLALFKPVSRDLFDLIAEDVDMAVVSSIDLAQLVRDVLRMSAGDPSGAAGVEAMVREQSQLYLGVNLLDDFVYQLGDQNYSFGYDQAKAPVGSNLPPVLEGLQSQVLAISLRNGALVSQTLGRVVEKAVELAGRPVATSQRFEGVDLHLLVNVDTGATVLAVAATDKFLYLSGQPELVKQAIKSAGGAAKPLGKDRDFRKAMRSVPQDSCMIAYGKKVELDQEDMEFLAPFALNVARTIGLLGDEPFAAAGELIARDTFAKDPLSLDFGVSLYVRRGPEFVHGRLLLSPRAPE